MLEISFKQLKMV